MSELETTPQQDSAAQTPPEAAMSDQDAQPAQEPRAPEPSTIGNAQIAVYRHELADAVYDPLDNSKNTPAGIDLAFGNISNTTIATAIFQAIFYGRGGEVLETVKHREVDILPGASRAILINSSLYDFANIQSYAVRLLHTTTTDVEKVQFRRHAIKTTETGQVVIQGIVKNISQAKTDAAIVATFYDANKETIGTKAIVLKELEPGTVRSYDLVFEPQKGDLVSGYSVAIGEIAE